MTEIAQAAEAINRPDSSTWQQRMAYVEAWHWSDTFSRHSSPQPTQRLGIALDPDPDGLHAVQINSAVVVKVDRASLLFLLHALLDDEPSS